MWKKTCKTFLEYNFGVNLKHANKNDENLIIHFFYWFIMPYYWRVSFNISNQMPINRVSKVAPEKKMLFGLMKMNLGKKEL